MKRLTSADEVLLSIGGIPDQNGDLLDIQDTLYHSDEQGFYLQRKTTQINKGNDWKNALIEECGDSDDTYEIRFVNERIALTRDQVIRYIIDIYMPEIKGIKNATHRALDCGGIERSCSSLF